MANYRLFHLIFILGAFIFSINLVNATQQFKETTYGIGISSLETTNFDFSQSDEQNFSFTFGFNPELYEEEALKKYVNRYDSANFRIEDLTSRQIMQTKVYYFASKISRLEFQMSKKFLGNKNGIHHFQITTMIDNVLNYETILKRSPKTDFYINVSGIGEKKIISNEKKKVKDATTNYCLTTIGNITYTLDPCSINTTMIDGQGDKDFTFTIKTSDPTTSYSFTSGRYKEGFPLFAILGGGEGGAMGNQKISKYFSDKQLKKGVYNGYLSIDIKSETGSKARELRLPIKIKVLQNTNTPDSNKTKQGKDNTNSNIDSYCSTIIDGISYSLDPCSINTTMIDGQGDKDFTFTIKTTDNSTVNYFYSAYGASEGFPIYSIGGGSGGGTRGSTNINHFFRDEYIKKGTYSGFQKITVASNSSKDKELRLFLTLEVK